MSSYKAQIEKSGPCASEALHLPTLWAAVQDKLASTLNQAAIETWIKPCLLRSVENQMVTLAVGSGFNLSIIDKRYRSELKQAFSQILGQPISLRYQVVPELAVPKATMQSNAASSQPASPPPTKPHYPLAQYQNPTNNPQVALLLEKYGDIRGVMKNHPFFKRIQRPVEEGGWGTDLGGLIYLAKTYTLERVLWAAKQAKDYQGAASRGSIFNHAVRKGLRAES